MIPHKGQRAGVKHVHTEIAANLQLQTLHDGQMSQIVHRNSGQVRGALQNLAELGLVCRAEHAGQNGAPFGVGGGQGFHPGQLLQRDIDPRRAAVQQVLGKLGSGGHGHRKGRRVGGAVDRLHLGDGQLPADRGLDALLRQGA